MIKSVEKQLIDWARDASGLANVVLTMPRGAPRVERVSLYLTALEPGRAERGGTRASALHASFRYLVTAWAPKRPRANRVLARLLFSAMLHPHYQVGRDPIPIELWRAMGIRQRPAFELVVEVHQSLPETIAPRVTAPPAVAGERLARLVGQVVGPGATPVAGATVTVRALGKSTRCDARGWFRLEALPAEGPLTLEVAARGVRRQVDLDEDDRADTTPVIEIDFETSPQET